MTWDRVWCNWNGIRLLVRAFTDYRINNSKILWSRGWYNIADWSGSGNFLYPAFPTRYRVLSLRYLRRRKGIIWLRLGSDPEKPELANGALGDINTFARDVIGTFTGPVVLVTTDGDRSVPSGLPWETVMRILADPRIVAWYSQNLDNSFVHKKLSPIPIGIDFHTRIRKGIGPRKKSILFGYAIRNSIEPKNRVLRIWSDVHLEQDLGNMVEEFPDDMGKPGAALFGTRGELRSAVEQNRLDAVVDAPEGRLPVEKVWEIYGRYFFVISLPGHGIDCHRTWEALALGAAVITIHSPIDPLLERYRVIFLDRVPEDNEWWRPMQSPGWLEQARDIVEGREPLDLTWDTWVRPMRKLLTSMEHKSSVNK